MPLALPYDGPDPERLLVVEDDPALREALAQTLSTICVRVETAASMKEAIRLVALSTPELVLLDLGLPDGDGADLLRRIRTLTDVPIIVLSGRDSEEEKVALLDAGADDFLTKPCGAAELIARVRGQVRRAAASVAARAWARLSLDGVEIDLLEQRVVRHGEPQRLTPTEWALLRALVLHAGRPLSPKQLWDMVWAREFGDYATHVRVHMTHLRRKVEPNPSMPRLIVTEPGVGYRFAAPR
jgi:two-component system KDP operon response regulator KdpE